MQKTDFKQINNFLSNIDDYYQSFIVETIDYLENSFPTQILQESIIDQLLAILAVEKKMHFDSLRFFWFQKLQDLLYIGELLHLTQTSSLEAEVIENLEDINVFWEGLAFGIPVESKISDELEKKSNELLGILEQQLISFYYLHLNQDISLPHPCLYFPVAEIGESGDELYLAVTHCVDITSTPLPLIISGLTDTTLHLDGELSELPITKSDNISKISPAILAKIEKIPTIKQIWKKTIFGLNDKIYPTSFTPFLCCSNSDNAQKILQTFSEYLVNLYDLLVDEEWNEEESEEQAQEIITSSAQSWLKWLYQREENNSSLIF